MVEVITDKQKDPLGAMLLDYLAGDARAAIEVSSEVVEIWNMTGSILFRSHEEMDELEQTALSLCRGKILDVGAGSGSHSLYLQGKKEDVDALDISPGAVEVMKRRGVQNVLHENLFSLQSRKYDTILMMMNGIGLCGTMKGYRRLLSQVKTLLKGGGQVIADSTDLFGLFGDDFDFSLRSYSGEIDFVMRYRDITSDPFDWLYIDFSTLQTLAAAYGFFCEKLMEMEGGRYLVRISQL